MPSRTLRVFASAGPGCARLRAHSLLPRASSAVAVLVLMPLFTLGGCQTTGGLIDPEDAVSQSPTTTNQLADVHTKLGIGYLRAGNMEQAYDRLKRAIAADPGYSTAHNALALVYERLGEPDKARDEYRIAVELNPRDSAAQNNYGQFLCRNGNYEEAQIRFQQVLANKLYASPELAHTNAGLCARSAGNLELAETHLRAALQRDPRIPPALYGMAALSHETDRALSARAYLQRYLEVAEHTPASLWVGVQVESKLGDADAANRYASILQSKFPDSNETRSLGESSTLSLQ